LCAFNMGLSSSNTQLTFVLVATSDKFIGMPLKYSSKYPDRRKKVAPHDNLAMAHRYLA